VKMGLATLTNSICQPQLQHVVVGRGDACHERRPSVGIEVLLLTRAGHQALIPATAMTATAETTVASCAVVNDGNLRRVDGQDAS
jgi:hypothetical protein